MQKQHFSINIDAPSERVWEVLWEDKTFRDWANIIDEGTYMVGELQEGNKVQFISSVSGYGVTSLVEKLVPNKFVLFRHTADTKDSGAQEREKDWTGGTESHSLVEENGVTTLTVEFDVPTVLDEIFQDRMPKALDRVKFLAEKK